MGFCSIQREGRKEGKEREGARKGEGQGRQRGKEGKGYGKESAEIKGKKY